MRIFHVVTVFVYRENWLNSFREKSSSLAQTCLVTLACGTCETVRCRSIEALVGYRQIMVMTSCRVSNIHVTPSITGHLVGAINTTMAELHALLRLPSRLLRMPTEPMGHFLPSVAFEVQTVALVLAPRVHGHFRLYKFHESPYML